MKKVGIADYHMRIVEAAQNRIVRKHNNFEKYIDGVVTTFMDQVNRSTTYLKNIADHMEEDTRIIKGRAALLEQKIKDQAAEINQLKERLEGMETKLEDVEGIATGAEQTISEVDEKLSDSIELLGSRVPENLEKDLSAQKELTDEMAENFQTVWVATQGATKKIEELLYLLKQSGESAETITKMKGCSS